MDDTLRDSALDHDMGLEDVLEPKFDKRLEELVGEIIKHFSTHNGVSDEISYEADMREFAWRTQIILYDYRHHRFMQYRKGNNRKIQDVVYNSAEYDLYHYTCAFIRYASDRLVNSGVMTVLDDDSTNRMTIVKENSFVSLFLSQLLHTYHHMKDESCSEDVIEVLYNLTERTVK